MDTINNFIALFGLLWFLWPLFTMLPMLPFKTFIPENNFITVPVMLFLSLLIIVGIIYFITKCKSSKKRKIIYITIILIILLPGFSLISFSYVDCLFFGAKDELLGLNTKLVGL